MKAQVMVKVINEVRSGVSPNNGNEWRSQDIVVSWQEVIADDRVIEQFIIGSLHGQNIDNFAKLNPAPGSYIDVDIRFATRSYNGRVYNDISFIVLP